MLVIISSSTDRSSNNSNGNSNVISKNERLPFTYFWCFLASFIFKCIIF